MNPVLKFIVGNPPHVFESGGLVQSNS